MRFHGAGFGTALAGAKLQGSTAGREGPWTDLVTIENEPGGWPGTVIPLDGREWHAVRLAGSKMGVVGFGAFTRQALLPGAVIKFSPAGERLAVISEVTNPLAIALVPARDRLLIFDNSPAQQIVAFTDLAGTPRLDQIFGGSGRFGKKADCPERRDDLASEGVLQGQGTRGRAFIGLPRGKTHSAFFVVFR